MPYVEDGDALANGVAESIPTFRVPPPTSVIIKSAPVSVIYPLYPPVL